MTRLAAWAIFQSFEVVDLNGADAVAIYLHRAVEKVEHGLIKGADGDDVVFLCMSVAWVRESVNELTVIRE